MKKLMVGVCAAVIATAFAHAEDVKAAEANKAAEAEKTAEGLEEEETPIVTGEGSVGIDSKYLSYGLVDLDDPILTMSAAMTFFDWVRIYFDNVRDINYRADRVDECHPEIDIVHSFWGFDVSLGHQWEFIKGDNTRFAMLEVTYTEFWLEPTLYIEKDCQRDHGTYVNLALAHEFSLIDGDTEEDDPILAFTPSIAQGWGDRRRVAGYLTRWNAEEEDYSDPVERNAFMDTALRGDLTWNICENLSLGGYVMYSDYVFDRHARHASRVYNEDYRFSYNFTWGLALTASF